VFVGRVGRVGTIASLGFALIGIAVVLSGRIWPCIGWQRSCVNVQLDFSGSTNLEVSRARTLVMEEIADGTASRRQVASIIVRSCPGVVCNARLPYSKDIIRQGARYAVRAVKTFGDGHVQSISSDAFVLTYGFGLDAKLQVYSDKDVQSIENVKYLAIVKDALTGAAGDHELFRRVIMQPEMGRRIEGLYRSSQLIAISISYQTGGRATRTYILKSGEVLAAIEQTTDFAKLGLAENHIAYGALSNGKDGQITQEELSDVLRRLANGGETRSPDLSGAVAVGEYAFGAGSNTITDCDTHERWWVVGDPRLISDLQHQFLQRKAEGAAVRLNFFGNKTVSSHGAASARLTGDVELSDYRWVNDVVSTDSCVVK
jgi:hypothetical protein